jgi:FlaA1/EpsC-like NDP-sugar epimerase
VISAFEDLLGREPISLELPELFEYVSGRTILITGAAGSIGSELARQRHFTSVALCDSLPARS